MFRLCALVALMMLPAIVSLAAVPVDVRQRLTEEAKGSVQLRIRPGTDTVTMARVAPGGDLMPSVATDQPRAKLAAFLDRHGDLFGLDGGDAALTLTRQRRDQLGYTHLRYQQWVGERPVYGAVLLAAVDPQQRLTTVSAGTRRIRLANTDARVSADSARMIARNAVFSAAGKTAARPTLDTGPPRLVIHAPALATARMDAAAYLAWFVTVTGPDSRDLVFVDADTGQVIDRIEGLAHALDRHAYDGGFGPAFEVWREGDPQPFGQVDIDRLITHARETYNLYATLTGGAFLSWDGAGGPMHGVLNPPGLSCPNASWNGEYSRYCADYTVDDVVAHEYTHGYTDATHDLVYRWQPGALNEAYSDIFGEVVDILNARGLDQPDLPRTADQCSAFGGHLPPLEVIAPLELAGIYPAGAADFNPSGATVTADIALARDDIAPVSDGCDPLVNATEIAGRIAIVENHGRCAGLIQTRNAQAAGAVGVVLVNTFSDVYYDLPGIDAAITIPTVVIGRSLGASIATGSSAVLRLAFSDTKDPSLRWLHREEYQSLSGDGGPNRDMWQPACFGHPGRVGDRYYRCDSSDSGGVHYNSGIVNHLFALLVDGGEFNGHSLTPVGLTRATHIYWRAMAHYQRPDSDFADHADALEAGCADLAAAGSPLYALRTDTDQPALSSVTISPAHCQSLALAVAATELRGEPPCVFEPLLDPEPPALCGESSLASTIRRFDFEDGIGGWLSGRRDIANPATFDAADWAPVDTLPHDRAGTAVFAPNPILGNCGTDTEAGVLYIESPVLTAPPADRSPWVVFHHLPATESGFDGGNLKIRVNEGPWQLVPDDLFRYNGYTGPLRTSDNPMGGEPAWHGTDDNRLTSDWGVSQIELDVPLDPGDTFRLRFELGSDGCNGMLGWYVDDVEYLSCPARPDADQDGIPDAADNCSATGNPDQRDSNADGYGNACDPDLNDDGITNFADLALMRHASFAQDPVADLDGNGTVDAGDLAILRSMFLSPPGPGAVTD